MPDIQFEPMAVKAFNDLMDFAGRTPKATGFISGTLPDGRRVEIRVRPASVDTTPVPGLVVRKGKLVRTVKDVCRRKITYVTDDGRERTCWLTTWQAWCRGAEVEL